MFFSSHVLVQDLHPRARDHLELVGADLTKVSQNTRKHSKRKMRTHVLSLITQEDNWADAVRGCDGVVHVASPLPPVGEEDDTIVDQAIKGNEHILQAAINEKVRRVVITSSAYAIFDGHPAARYGAGSPPFTADDWSIPERQGFYPKSKTLAERRAWEIFTSDEAKAAGLEVVTVCPGWVIGPMVNATVGRSSDVILRYLTAAFPGTPAMGELHQGCTEIARLPTRPLVAFLPVPVLCVSDSPIAGRQRGSVDCRSDVLPLHSVALVLDVRDVALAHVACLEGGPEVVGKRFPLGEEAIQLIDIATVSQSACLSASRHREHIHESQPSHMVCVCVSAASDAQGRVWQIRLPRANNEAPDLPRMAAELLR